MAKYEVKLKGSLIDKRIYVIDCDELQKGWTEINFCKHTSKGGKELVALFDRQAVECVVKVGD